MQVATSVFVLLDIKETTVMVSSGITLDMVYEGLFVYWENKHFLLLLFLKYIHQEEQDNKSLLSLELVIQSFL